MLQHVRLTDYRALRVIFQRVVSIHHFKSTIKNFDAIFKSDHYTTRTYALIQKFLSFTLFKITNPPLASIEITVHFGKEKLRKTKKEKYQKTLIARSYLLNFFTFTFTKNCLAT